MNSINHSIKPYSKMYKFADKRSVFSHGSNLVLECDNVVKKAYKLGFNGEKKYAPFTHMPNIRYHIGNKNVLVSLRYGDNPMKLAVYRGYDWELLWKVEIPDIGDDHKICFSHNDNYFAVFNTTRMDAFCVENKGYSSHVIEMPPFDKKHVRFSSDGNSMIVPCGDENTDSCCVVQFKAGKVHQFRDIQTKSPPLLNSNGTAIITFNHGDRVISRSIESGEMTVLADVRELEITPRKFEMSPYGGTIVVQADDKRIFMWQMENKRWIKNLPSGNTVVWVPLTSRCYIMNDDHFFTVDSDGRYCRKDIPEGKQVVIGTLSGSYS